MNIILYILIVFMGLLFGSLFNRIGNVEANDKNYSYVICKKCNKRPKFFHVSFFSYFLNLGKCSNCGSKISMFPIFIEITTSFLFLICYLVFKDIYPYFINILYSLLFVSSLIIIFVSDINYMIIPDKIIFLFSFVMIALKIVINFYNEKYLNILDVGYDLIFIIYEGLIMYLIMFFIKYIGDRVFKKDSLGNGDLKLMFYISIIIGYKLSIVVIFLAAFLALPLSIINMIKSNEVMLAFGPYLAISSIIIFLTRIDFNTIINFLI